MRPATTTERRSKTPVPTKTVSGKLSQYKDGDNNTMAGWRRVYILHMAGWWRVYILHHDNLFCLANNLSCKRKYLHL